MIKQFIVTIHQEDLDEGFKDDLEGHVRDAIGDKFGFDAEIGFSVVEVN